MRAEWKKSIIDWAILLSFLVVGYAAWKLTPDWDHEPKEAEAYSRSTSDEERPSARPVKVQR